MSLPAVDEMISKLETRLKDNPKDAEGWRMLGWSRYRTEDYTGAAKAYAEAAKYAPSDADTQSAYGEALTRAAGGLVTPDAVTALQACLKLDKSNPRARFLLGLKQEQDGKPAAALDAWLTLLKEAKPEDDWVDDVRGRVVELAETSGIDVSKRLPPVRKSSLPTATSPGPNAGDIAAASAMPADDRQVMIENMVSRLDAKLRQNPDDLDGWLKLIQARRVLGQADLANDAVARGRKAFAKNAAAQARLSEAASAPLNPP
jgi:cytochrome c-type biogenesis protein CcmH